MANSIAIGAGRHRLTPDGDLDAAVVPPRGI